MGELIMEAQEKTYLIYKHVNKINGKIYIGQTCLSTNKRWQNGYGYKSYTTLPNNKKIPSHFWSAIQKYGWDNFEHKVLIHGLTKEQADSWEKKLIKRWDLMNPQRGYNKQCGGSHGTRSQEIIQKFLGELNPKAIPVYCIETGERFGTIKEAQIKYSTSHIKDACNDFSKIRGGMHWALEKDWINMDNTIKKEIIDKDTSSKNEKNPNAKKILCIETGEVFNCIKHAMEKFDISRVALNNHINGKTKTCCGYHWTLLT